MHRTRARTVTLGLLTALIACESRLTGNEGNFQFAYEADDRVTDFNKPIAVGAMLDITVRDAGALQAVDLLAAAFDDPAVLDVASFEGATITVKGVGAGQALLEVEGTTQAGETLTDSINLLAAVPEVLRLSHSCATGSEAAYIAGQRVYIAYEMEKANGQPVIGYGYTPFTASNAALLSQDSSWKGQQFAAYDTLAAGSLTLDSDLDDTSLSLEIIEEGAIDGVEEPVAFVLEDIDAGDTNAFYVRPTTGSLTVCQADIEKRVTSLTPEACTISDSDPRDGVSYEYGWFNITGVAQGTCTYEVSFPGGSGGAGTTATFSYEIQP